jgi:hypothetical protein
MYVPSAVDFLLQPLREGSSWPRLGHCAEDQRKAAEYGVPDVARAHEDGDDHLCEAAAVETIVAPAGDFLRRWVYENPELVGRDLLFQWIEDPTEREEIAAAHGISLGALLRPFNETAPLSEPIEFKYRSVSFSAIAMAGICDDVCGDRYPRFGEPITLRCYFTDPTLLPQSMYEAADWNFMDAGRPGYLGYAYGVRHGRTVYLAGLQSDLAVRYSYLFQGRGGRTAVRMGDEVAEREPADMVARYGAAVPVLRRTFQRYWIPVLIGAVCAWARTEPGLGELGLLKYELGGDERRRGNVVNRVYQELPERMASELRCVRLDGRCHVYSVSTLAAAEGYLGARWSPGDRAVG